MSKEQKSRPQSVSVNFAGGARVHDKGEKADRDRAVILHSYLAMCEEFRVPRSRRLSTREIATMTNTQLYQASKDLYNGATIKQATRLAVRLGTISAPESDLQKLVGCMKRHMRRLKIRLGLVPLVEAPTPSPPSRSDLVLAKPRAANA